LVLAFKTSDNLAAAYGIAVTGTFLCTCVLAMVVFRRQSTGRAPPRCRCSAEFFLIDLVFFSANTLKILEGGWVPLVLGIALTALMTSWKADATAAGTLATGQPAACTVPRTAAAVPAPCACPAWRSS